MFGTQEDLNMLTKYKAGICCNGNVKLLKSNLNYIMASDTLLLEMGKNAIFYARQFHKIDGAVEKVNQIIQNLLP